MVLCHCDNQAVVSAVRGGYCKDPSMAQMLRCLFFLEAKFDLTLTAVHVPGVENGPADSLSRNKLSSFFDLVSQAQATPTQVPEELVNRLCFRTETVPGILSNLFLVSFPTSRRSTMFVCSTFGRGGPTALICQGISLGHPASADPWGGWVTPLWLHGPCWSTR